MAQRTAVVLPVILSITAGSADAITFLGLDGLFTAHITGNLVILAAHLVTGFGSTVALLLSVPVFFVALVLTKALAELLQRIGVATLLPLLIVQSGLLLGALIIVAASGPRLNPNAAIGIVTGMLCVCAMAVQNALVQLSLHGAPTTAVMTTNLTRFVLDFADALFAGHSPPAEPAWTKAMRSGPTIFGFIVGCGLGAACYSAFGLRSLTLPVAASLLAVAVPSTSTQ